MGDKSRVRLQREYRLPDKDFGLRYRSESSTTYYGYDLLRFLPLALQNHYLKLYRYFQPNCRERYPENQRSFRPVRTGIFLSGYGLERGLKEAVPPTMDTVVS